MTDAQENSGSNRAGHRAGGVEHTFYALSLWHNLTPFFKVEMTF